MNKHSVSIVMLGVALVLPSLPAMAAHWDHTEESQGRDGTLWANIPWSRARMTRTCP